MGIMEGQGTRGYKYEEQRNVVSKNNKLMSRGIGEVVRSHSNSDLHPLNHITALDRHT